ncbi:MAG: Ig-like domain-containing protein [Planctomycetota bacterium]
MKSLLPVVLLGLSLGLSSCSGSGGSGSSFAITSCSLGCAGSGTGGDGQVSCGIQDVFVNGELRITFSSPVNESSLTVFTVQVTEFGTGKTPPADRFVDAADPRTIVYRPKLTFDSSGAPVFGLTNDSSYTIKLPGSVEDPGEEYVRSSSGASNRHRLLCTVEASLGVLDSKPGAPTAAVTVDVVTAYDPVTGLPSEFDLDVPADGKTDVFRDTAIRFSFDDLMNPATLVNPVTSQSNSIRVLIDPDGITSDATDQQDLLGTFTINLDQDALRTTVTFFPELGLPSAGSDAINKRKIVIDLPPTISDLGGNPLTNFGEISFTPEFVPFAETDLVEDFFSTGQNDLSATGADWGESFPGNLRPGISGGSGRLGSLFLDSGQVLTLNTDSEDFSSVTDKSIFDPANVLDATFDGVDFTIDPITDGVFEFSTIRLNSGSQLRFEGSNPVRLFVRGEATVQGRIDVSGSGAIEHDDELPLGGEVTTGGPSGGNGGAGGRLPTWINFESVTGVLIPDPPVDPPTLGQLDGQDGVGVVDNTIAPSGTNLGFGGGGVRWPSPTATFPAFHMPVDPDDILGVDWDIIQICQTKMKGAVGAGGAFGLNGGTGINKPIPGGGFIPPEPPDSIPGQASDFGLGIGSDPTSPERTLSPEAGYLHGGPGGGGGGSHIAISSTNGKVFSDCTTDVTSSPAVISIYDQHSGPAGGAGGGAIQLQAGSRTVLGGVIDAGGGIGGSKLGTNNATSGGGGAGGAILLQSPDVQISSVPGRIDISGGIGGFGAGASLGGDGGAGLLRLETEAPLPDIDQEATKVAPNPTALADVGATPIDIISIGELMPITVGPSSVNGVQSCWLRPEGNFFLLNFLDDDGDQLGWDMQVLPNPPSLGAQSFRGDNVIFGAPLEMVLGNELGVSPLVVRFQGARSIKVIDNLCNVTLGGPDSQIFPGSLTGWVNHPAELNAFFADPALRPNMIRFQILFDTSQPALAQLVSVTELFLRVLPD